MTDDLCPREAEVLRAGESGEWTPDLQAHLVTCAACREVEAVTQVLRAAVDDEPVAVGASAEDIWWRAQLQARQEMPGRARCARWTPSSAPNPSWRWWPSRRCWSCAVMRSLRALMAWATSDATGQAVQALMPPALLPVLMLGALLGGLVLLVGLGAVVAND